MVLADLEGDPDERRNVKGGTSTATLTKQFFSKVPDSLREKIENIYSMDFQMFDYDPKKY